MTTCTLALYSYQPLLIEALVSKVSKSDSLTLVGASFNSDDIMGLVRQQKPSLFLVDCGRPDRGIDVITEIRKSSPDTKVVIFTGIESAEHAVIALDSGASGYISSACSKIDVVTALELIATGQSFISPHIAALVIKRMRLSSDERKQAADQRLSHREEQIARLLVQGRTNRAIADLLGLSEKTIKYYMSNLMQKFAARNRLELAMALPKASESARYFQ